MLALSEPFVLFKDWLSLSGCGGLEAASVGGSQGWEGGEAVMCPEGEMGCRAPSAVLSEENTPCFC